ncbi:hypothetical protein [Zavarzinia sp.]|uniref:hypothetical protein n=1 Tax=Zavarzinia sp. TaxID=2027920 RepID=UPI003567C613
MKAVSWSTVMEALDRLSAVRDLVILMGDGASGADPRTRRAVARGGEYVENLLDEIEALLKSEHEPVPAEGEG